MPNNDKAWKLIPEPKDNWEASTWLLAAIGDACFLSNNFRSGNDAFAYATRCPGGFGNSFIHLRLGQCQFELGNLDAAADELCRAYMGAGSEIFSHDNPGAVSAGLLRRGREPLANRSTYGEPGSMIMRLP